MRVAFLRVRSRRVSIKMLVAVLGALLAAAVVGAALAATQTKKYSAAIEQTGQNSYLFTLTNDPTSTQPFGSANVTLPEAFSSISAPLQATTSDGKIWNVATVGRTVELRARNVKSLLAPRQSLSLTVTATASCGLHTWETLVKQSNNFLGSGNDFDGTFPSVTVIGPAASFAFSEIGDPQEVGVEFPTTVTASDGCGRTATFYGGTPTLDGLDETQTAAPTYVRRAPFAGGSATYDVTAVKAQQDATLGAEDGDATGTSTPAFDVVSEICTGGSPSCRASHDDGTIVEVPPPAAGTTTLSLSGPGRSFACGSSTPTPNIGSSVLVVPAEDGYAGPIEVDITWSLLGASGGNRVLCMSKDGITYAPVARCGRTPIAPCELSRTRSGDLLRSIILIDPEDPSFDLG